MLESLGAGIERLVFRQSQLGVHLLYLRLNSIVEVLVLHRRWMRILFTFQLNHLRFFIQFTFGCLFFDYFGLIISWPWVYVAFFNLENLSFLFWQDICCLFLQKSLMQLIRYAKISSIFTRPRVLIFYVKNRDSIQSFIVSLLSIEKFIEIFHGLCFLLIIKVHSWTSFYPFDVFLESSSLRVEVAFITSVVADFRSVLIVILPWSWRFERVDLFDIAKTISLRIKARRQQLL